MKHFDQKTINEISRSYREVDTQLPVSKSAWAGILFSSLVALIVFWIVVIAIWV